jgi:photosystem II stability/assembly factor-like uncharacterized protein
MKKYMTILFLILSIQSNAQWTIISPDQWGSGHDGQMLDSLTFYCITRDTVEPWNPLIIKTEDQGESWEVLCKSFTSPIQGINDYVIISKDSFMIFTHLRNIYTSTNGGQTLNLLTNLPGELKALGDCFKFYNPYSKTIFILTKVDDIEVYYKTEDFGNTWTKVNSSNNANFTMLLYCFVNRNTGFLIGKDSYIYTTIDNGSNWVKTTGQVNHIYSEVIFTNINIGYGYQSALGPFKTIDGGENWTLVNNGLPELIQYQVYISDMYFSDDNNGWLILYRNGSPYYYRTEDGGAHWGRLEFFTPVCKLETITGLDKNHLIFWPKYGNDCIYLMTEGGGPYSGISESKQNEKDFTIYPNPPQSTFTLRCNNEFIQDIHFSLLAINGQVVYEKESSSKEISIDIRKFPAGVYFVKVVSENGVWIEKIMIEK